MVGVTSSGLAAWVRVESHVGVMESSRSPALLHIVSNRMVDCDRVARVGMAWGWLCSKSHLQQDLGDEALSTQLLLVEPRRGGGRGAEINGTSGVQNPPQGRG